MTDRDEATRGEAAPGEVTPEQAGRDDGPALNDDGPALNREMRRARQFDQPTDRNPAHGGSPGDDSESYAGRPDQDIVRTTGPGTGGATESNGRVKHHEGQHLGNQPNS